ncbi:ScyD/ScyE family protein [Geodermatophilus ruber]|uniref:ScyD/ScyE family protein n=1 Tax=Geodermatophilus ruber TaxID=504800 RepID=A0A1I4C5W2_9ACTN|nr:ScyD/ScyE family protein [Geodermatophilus ruber]SFK75777.1 hypothetical protein SAMN04488085_103331 [Geodermatophilus ruber]
MKPSRAAAVMLTALGVIAASPGTAGADDRDRSGRGDASVTTVAEGLSGPRQLNEYRGQRFVVAESDSGGISAIDVRTGTVTTLLDGLFSPQGVDYDDGLLFVAVGAPAPVPGAPQPGPGQDSMALLIAKPNGEVLKKIDLLAYEKANNPDGQDPDAPDAQSNPFSVLAQDRRVLVADAAANAVLAVDRRTGKVSTFFVPPLVSPGEVEGCAGRQANPGTVGCDPVPTGVVEGRDGLLYVSTLGAEVPGAARIYVLNQRGHVVRVIEDLTSATGVAVGRDGTIYVSEITEGQIVRIDRRGNRTYSPIPTPVGVLVEDGRLYSTADSAGFPGPVPGAVVRVGAGTFGPTPAPAPAP